MGQGASTPKRKKKKKSKHSSAPQDASLQKLDEKIAMFKQDLIRTKQQGEVNKRGQEDEIYKFEMELYKKKYLLHKQGKDAKSYLSFWEYVEIVNTVLHADSFSVGSGDMTLDEYKAKMKVQAEEERLKAEKGTVVRHTGHFNIYSFFEAFLLRRLHIAMILKHQRAKQSDVWNDIIMFMYNMMPGMKKQTKAVNEKYITLKPESNETMREMIKLQKKKIKLYGRMIENLKEELEEERMASSMDDDKMLQDLDVPTKSVDASVPEDFNTAKYYQKGSFKQDDDEMSFKSMSSRRSGRSKRSRASKAKTKTAAADNPRWMKSRNSKMSKTINRDVDSSFRSNKLESSERSSRSPSPAGSPMVSPGASKGTSKAVASNSDKITDDDIERFLYPNKPVRKSGGSKRRVVGSGGAGVSNRESLPSDLEFDNDGRTTVSALHDDVSSVGSGHVSENPKSLAEAKAKKKELDNLIKSMETPGEEDE